MMMWCHIRIGNEEESITTKKERSSCGSSRPKSPRSCGANGTNSDASCSSDRYTRIGRVSILDRIHWIVLAAVFRVIAATS